MGCLIHKESKLNALEVLKDENIISNTREILDEPAFDAKHQELVNTANRVYNLNLESLFDKEGSNVSKFGIKQTPYNRTDSRSDIIRATPIEDSFNQIDNARKVLGIYDSKESIGEYKKRMGLIGKPMSSMIEESIEELDEEPSEYGAIQDFQKLLDSGEIKQICKIR